MTTLEETKPAETPTATEYALGPLAQIPSGEGREFPVGAALIAVFHARNGEVYATQSLCPHRNGPLSDGILGGSTLICPFHAWKFDLDTGEALLGDCAITVYPVRLAGDGQIFVTFEAPSDPTV